MNPPWINPRSARQSRKFHFAVRKNWNSVTIAKIWSVSNMPWYTSLQVWAYTMQPFASESIDLDRAVARTFSICVIYEINWERSYPLRHDLRRKFGCQKRATEYRVAQIEVVRVHPEISQDVVRVRIRQVVTVQVTTSRDCQKISIPGKELSYSWVSGRD